MLKSNDARDASNQERAQCSLPPIPQKAEHGWQDKADHNCDGLDVPVLPAHKLVALKIGYVVEGRIGVQFEKQPSDMRVKEAF